MASFNTATVLACTLLSFNAWALEVTVSNPVLSACNYANGVLQADITGGVEPYTILWSTGATSAAIENLSPGSYSITVTDGIGTQATADGFVQSLSSLVGGQTYSTLAHCPGAYPMVDLNLYTRGAYASLRYGPGPYTITGPASIVSSTVLPADCGPMDSLVRVEMNEPPGSGPVITWTNALGCPGESWVILSTEVIWPQVFVTNVQGACGGGNNGSFTITIVGGTQLYRAKLYRPNGSLLSVVPSGGQVQGQLAPGDYQLAIYTETCGPTDDEQCADLTTITVPDLAGTCGNVNGRVFVDGNANCAWSSGENGIPEAIVEFTPGPYYATTNFQGLYSANLPLGTFDHSVIHPGAQQECPGPFTLATGTGSVNEPIGCSSLFPLDVQVSMANGPARPGSAFRYAISARNNTVANAGPTTLTMEYDANLIYSSAQPAPSSIVGNTLTWNLSGMYAFSTNYFYVDFTLPPDMGLIGTLLNSTTTIATTNTDGFLANNTWSSEQEITNSFDPNNKIAQTSSRQSDSLYFIGTDQYIDYTLNFQNTGSDTAFLVVVTDTLPSTLDPASLQVGAASHPFNWNVAGAGVLTFNFVNIQLPDSNVNEAASHGFVSFRIKARDPLLPGTVISNTANIFFDYNEPVITEPSVLVAELSTEISETELNGIRIMPNPATDILQIILPENTKTTVTVLSADGRLIQTPKYARSQRIELDVRALAPGLYFLQTSVGTVRFFKQ